MHKRIVNACSSCPFVLAVAVRATT